MSYEYLSIKSEIAEIEGILRSLSPAQVIKKLTFESRLRSAKSALEAFQRLPASKKATLTFRGKPVVGSHGLHAEFGSRAALHFADAFAAVAAGLGESLRYKGPIPDRAKHQLLITGTAIGSFGFEFELPAEKYNLFGDEPQAEQALKKLQQLMQQSAEGSDDEISELVDEIHPRAVAKIHEFLSYLAQHQAWCGLEFAGRFFRYNHIDQLKLSTERLLAGNIKESSEILTGAFTGILPNDRTFEFTQAESGNVIKGKIAPEVDDPDLLLRVFYKKPVTASFAIVQVGQSRPRYRFISADTIKLA